MPQPERYPIEYIADEGLDDHGWFIVEEIGGSIIGGPFATREEAEETQRPVPTERHDRALYDHACGYWD